MSVSIGTIPQLNPFFEGSGRASRGGSGGGQITRGDARSTTGTGAGFTTPQGNDIRQRNSDAPGRGSGGTIQRLDAQTLGALTGLAPSADAAPSQQQPPVDTGTNGSTADGTGVSGKRVAIDLIHVELPNGAKFDLRHVPGDGEDSDEALQSLLKAAEELIKELGGIAGALAPDKHAGTQDDDAANTAYARQLSAGAARSAAEGTNVTA
jgi:hypothetical protein